MRKVDVVVLDKTGALTEGHPTATDGCGHSRRKNTSKMYFAAELKSEHPLAGAIVAVLQDAKESLSGYWVDPNLKDFLQ